MKWKDFRTKWHNEYDRDNHVIIIGPTRSGKTQVATELVEERGYVVATGVKYRDDTLMKLIKTRGYKRITDWTKHNDKRLVLWPKNDNMDTLYDEQRKVFKDMFNNVYIAGGRAIWIDEMRVMCDPGMVGLRADVIKLLVAGASNNISVVGCSQRPAWVPQEAFSESKHMILFRTNHVEDLKKIGSFNGIAAKDVVTQVQKLEKYEFVHANLLTGEMVTSKME